MSKLSGKNVDILSPRKNKSLVSILKNYATFQTDGLALMSEENEGLYRTRDGRKKFSVKRKEKGFLKALPMCQFYIPGKSSTMEIESKVGTSSSSSATLTSGVIDMSMADDSYKVNVVARDLHEDSSILPIEDFDSTVSSCGALESESSNLGSSCPEMSYLSNMAMAAKSSHRDRSEERKSSIKLFKAQSHEQTLKRKRRIPHIISSPEASEPSSANSSIESCPSVAKKVKFFPISTSTPTKKRLHSSAHQFRGVKKLLEYSGSCSEDSEPNKLEQNVGDSRNALALLDDGSLGSHSFGKNEIKLALMNSCDEIMGMDRTSADYEAHKNETLSNLVEKFSSKIRFTMSHSGSGHKRKAESIDSTTDEPPIYNSEDWSMGSGKYDVKYPAECVTLSNTIRSTNAIAQELPPLHSQQYKPLKQSFDDSYKLAPIQENLRKVDDGQSKECNKPAYFVGRQRCIGIDSKMKPKTRLRRRYKSESDLFERSIVPDGRQAVNQTSDAAQEYEEYEDEDSTSNDPGRSVSFDSESGHQFTMGQESVMEIFCEQMHDLQMDNT